MKCSTCNGTDFEEREIQFTPKVKNEAMVVLLKCSVCKGCGTPVIDSQQANILRKSASDEYRKLHELYTSKEIIAFRNTLEMSQLEFAQYLNVGEASVKRWESYYIQDSSQNDHIRVKYDQNAALANHLFILSKSKAPSLHNGNRRFSVPLFANISEYFLNRFPGCGNYLPKLYFYADFLHFKRYEKSITGSQYLPLKNGPCPYPAIRSISQIPLFKENEWKKNVFNKLERKTIDDVSAYYDDFGGEKLINLSRKERGFLETEETDFISYKYASDLNLK